MFILAHHTLVGASCRALLTFISDPNTGTGVRRSVAKTSGQKPNVENASEMRPSGEGLKTPKRLSEEQMKTNCADTGTPSGCGMRDIDVSVGFRVECHADGLAE